MYNTQKTKKQCLNLYSSNIWISNTLKCEKAQIVVTITIFVIYTNDFRSCVTTIPYGHNYKFLTFETIIIMKELVKSSIGLISPFHCFP